MRSNTRDAAHGVSVAASRSRYVAADDAKLMQEAQVQVFHDETQDGIERFQNYGHSSVPLPPDQNSPKAAEAAILYLGGSRSHPVIIAVDDRRHRVQNLKPGESTLYDDQKQQVYISRTGIVINGGTSNLPVTVVVNNTKLTIADGKITCQVGGTNGPALVVKADAVYAGGDPDVIGSSSFFPVQTTGGTSNKLKALVG